MDASKIDLSKPAFGPDSQKVSELAETPATPPVEEVKVEVPVVEEQPQTEDAPEEQKVPYSRFKKFHDRALQAEREAAEWRARAETRTEAPAERNEEGLPSEWVELYGDSEASQKAWKIQERREQQLIDRAREQALEAVSSQRQEESKRLQENEQTIDQNLSALGELVGRDLTEKEQSAVLDIVDDFTPKDDDGNYKGDTIPFEKAWEIYQLKTQAQKAPTTKSRDAVAALTSSPTQGEPGLKAEKDKDFNPMNWSAYKDRL